MPNYCRWFLMGAALVGLMALAAAIAGPFRSAVQISYDEFFEPTKAVLWANGYPLYTQIWDDQPALFTELLGTLFKWFGPGIVLARGLATCFGLLLLTGCFVLVKKRVNVLAGCVAAAALLSAPYILDLSIAPVLEVPAIATALWALWPVYRRVENRRWPWLAVSGAVLAAALQIKLTAVIVVPALAVEIWLHSPGTTRMERLKNAVRNLAVWGIATVGAFLFLGMALGTHYRAFWDANFASATRQSGGASGYAFTPLIFLESKEALWGAGAGLFMLLLRGDWKRLAAPAVTVVLRGDWKRLAAPAVTVVLRGDWKRLAFPIVMLATATAIHWVHRPYWYYYYVHFAIPLAWLTGYGVSELCRLAAQNMRGLSRAPFAAVGSMIATAALIWLVGFNGERRLASDVRRMRDLPRVADSPLIAKMRAYADRTRWVYTPATIYPFHARLLVIPELSVVSYKRLWSGELTDEKILRIVKQYQPQQLLLMDETSDPGFKEFVDANYTPVYDREGFQLYVANSLVKK